MPGTAAMRARTHSASRSRGVPSLRMCSASRSRAERTDDDEDGDEQRHHGVGARPAEHAAGSARRPRPLRRSARRRRRAARRSARRARRLRREEQPGDGQLASSATEPTTSTGTAVTETGCWRRLTAPTAMTAAMTTRTAPLRAATTMPPRWWPKVWRAPAGRRLRETAYQVSPSVAESVTRWPASLSSASDPDARPPAISAAAMTVTPAIARRTRDSVADAAGGSCVDYPPTQPRAEPPWRDPGSASGRAVCGVRPILRRGCAVALQLEDVGVGEHRGAMSQSSPASSPLILRSTIGPKKAALPSTLSVGTPKAPRSATARVLGEDARPGCRRPPAPSRRHRGPARLQ